MKTTYIKCRLQSASTYICLTILVISFNIINDSQLITAIPTPKSVFLEVTSHMFPQGQHC